MAELKVRMRGNFKTVKDLENRCNLALTDIEGGKLEAVEAVGSADKHVTEGTFDETPGKPLAAGNLKFELDNAGTNTAWINGIKIKVSFK